MPYFPKFSKEEIKRMLEYLRKHHSGFAKDIFMDKYISNPCNEITIHENNLPQEEFITEQEMTI